MIPILAIIVFGVLIILGVICFIVAFSSSERKKPNKKGSLNEKEIMTMVKYSGRRADLVSLPDGTTAAIPKQFDPLFVMEQLGNIQNSPNLISAYIDSLTARFRANREIAYIKKMKEYYIALAGGMEAQLKLLELQDIFEDFIDIENRVLRKKITRRTLEKKLAKIEAETEKYKRLGYQQREHEKINSSYQKSYSKTKEKIDRIRGHYDAIDSIKQEQLAKIQNIKRGRSEDQLDDFEKEEIDKINRYYLGILDNI